MKRNKARQGKAKQSKANKTKHSIVKQSKAKQNKTKQNKTKQNKTNNNKIKILGRDLYSLSVVWLFRYRVRVVLEFFGVVFVSFRCRLRTVFVTS